MLETRSSRELEFMSTPRPLLALRFAMVGRARFLEPALTYGIAFQSGVPPRNTMSDPLVCHNLTPSAPLQSQLQPSVEHSWIISPMRALTADRSHRIQASPGWTTQGLHE